MDFFKSKNVAVIINDNQKFLKQFSYYYVKQKENHFGNSKIDKYRFYLK